MSAEQENSVAVRNQGTTVVPFVKKEVSGLESLLGDVSDATMPEALKKKRNPKKKRADELSEHEKQVKDCRQATIDYMDKNPESILYVFVARQINPDCCSRE